MNRGVRAVPPLHPMERGLGGEVANATRDDESGSPSPSDGEGAGGEAASTTNHDHSGSPSPRAERGLGGEVRDCFRAGTQVKTETGWRSIEQIRAGDRVWTHLARLRRVLGVQKRPHVGKMVGIRLEGSSTVVWCTPEQQFLVAQGPHPPTPTPPGERGGRTNESGGKSHLTPQPPLHPMERGGRRTESGGTSRLTPQPLLHPMERRGQSADKSGKSPQAQAHAQLGGLNPSLLKFARELRRKSTEPEDQLWQCLRGRRLNGFKFRRQHPLGQNYIPDFYCAETKVSVELDGGVHDWRRAKWADGIRHRQIEEAGVKILRFRNERIAQDLEAVLSEIEVVCAGRRLHPPAPSPRVERGLGGEVLWRTINALRPGDFIITEELGHSSRIASLDRVLTNETVFGLTIEDDHSYITRGGIAHNYPSPPLTISELLANEPLRLHEFPVARERIFLAHAGDCPLPRRVADAIASYARQSTTGDQEAVVFPGILTRGRKLAAQLLNCDADEVAFVGPTSLALSFIASGLKFERRDNVLIYFDDYPANVYPWMALAEQGVEVRRLHTPALGVIRPADVLSQVDQNTRLVSLASCHFISGERIDIAAIGRALRERQILFCLDAIQTLGAFPTTVEHVDLLAADAHKWLLGPCGAGLLYVRRSLQEHLNPPVYGWYNVRCPDFVAQEQIVYRAGAKKYEAGTHNLVGLVGLLAALELVLELGVGNIARELLRKRALLLPALQSRGWHVLQSEATPQTASAIVSYHRPGADLAALHQRLLSEGIVTSLRKDRAGLKYLRLSPHFYNTDAELERLLAAL